MKHMKRIIPAVVLIAAVIGGYAIYRSRTALAADGTDAGTYTQTVQVRQGNLTATLSVVGQLEPTQSATLAFELMDGTASLTSLDVQAGSTVTAGQVLATIDPAPYEQAVDQAQSDLLAAEETLADLQTPATELAIAQADVAVAKAQQSLAQAQADLEDLATPDTDSLQSAVVDAQESLALLQLQTSLAEHGSLAKSERDLRYSISWYERRIAELEAIRVPSPEETDELTETREDLSEAQADLAQVQAQRELDRQAKAAELQRDQATLADAQETLAEAQAGSDELTLAKAQLAINEAQVNLLAAQEARADLDVGADSTQIAAAQAAVDKKRLALSDAQDALAGTQLTAPFGGTILETTVSAGSTVAANTSVLSLANLDTLQVVAAVDETSIRQVSKGQQATVTFDAFPGETFTGQVLDIPLQGTLQGDVMVYSVPLSLVGAEDLPLLVGMTANVEIAVGTVTNALLVPTMALSQSNGLYQVLVPNSSDPTGQPLAVPVEVGLSDGTYTAVTKGLIAGDDVVVQYDATTESGFRNMGGSGNMFMGITRSLGR